MYCNNLTTHGYRHHQIINFTECDHILLCELLIINMTRIISYLDTCPSNYTSILIHSVWVSRHCLSLFIIVIVRLECSQTLSLITHVFMWIIPFVETHINLLIINTQHAILIPITPCILRPTISYLTPFIIFIINHAFWPCLLWYSYISKLCHVIRCMHYISTICC